MMKKIYKKLAQQNFIILIKYNFKLNIINYDEIYVLIIKDRYFMVKFKSLKFNKEYNIIMLWN